MEGRVANPYRSGFSNRKAAAEFRTAASWLKSAEVNGRRGDVFRADFPTNLYEKRKKVESGAKKASRKS
jgi:hypothetical protein